MLINQFLHALHAVRWIDDLRRVDFDDEIIYGFGVKVNSLYKIYFNPHRIANFLIYKLCTCYLCKYIFYVL